MEIRSVYQSVFPIFLFSVLSGTSTICPVKKDGFWTISTDTKFKIIHYLWLFTLILLLILHYFSEENKADFYTGLAGFGINVMKWVLVAEAFYIKISVNRNSDEFKKFLEDIADVDDKLKGIKIDVNHSQQFWSEMFESISTFIIVCFVIWTELKSGNRVRLTDRPPTQLLYLYCCIVCFNLGIRGITLILLIMWRFHLINHQLNLFDISSMQKKSDIVIRIGKLNEIHLYLNDIFANLHRALQKQWLTLLAVLFIINICLLFVTYLEYYIQGDTYAAISWFLWFCMAWIGFLQFCYIYHFTIIEAKRTGIILHKFLLEDINPSIISQMSLFSNQVLNSVPECAACGFFPVNGTLLYTVIGATFTYLIIMLQFEEGNQIS